MPAATTHVEFAKDVYALLDESARSLISDSAMYFMGSQGPDMLFFSGFSILPGTLSHIGGRMHDEKVDQVIRYFDAHAVSDPALRSYFFGYLCHYALDSTAHPLICALAHSESMKTGRTESEIHFRIEGEYDVYTLRQKGRDWNDYNVYEDLRLNSEDTRRLAILYHGMLGRVFSLDISVPHLIRAIGDVSRMTRLLKPGKAKYAFAGYMESLLKQPKMVTGMMLSEDKSMDDLNEEHHLWYPVYAPNDARSESFPDLYSRAMGLAARLIHSHNDDDFTVNFVGAPYPQENR